MSALPGPGRSAMWWLASVLLTALVAMACSTSGGSAIGSPTPAAVTPSASPVVAATPVASVPVMSPSIAAPSASSAQAGVPPSASMSAEGGDAVAGQLGSYTWAGGGSDSPWLPGSTIAVGAGEPLTVRLDPAIVVADWTATRVAAGTTDGSGAVSLAAAEGEPIRFIAPAVGTWSVQVQVRFGRGSDAAAYYWRLDVR